MGLSCSSNGKTKAYVQPIQCDIQSIAKTNFVALMKGIRYTKSSW